jgi:hypothetical protein
MVCAILYQRFPSDGRRTFSLPGTIFAPIVDSPLEVPAIFVVSLPTQISSAARLLDIS